MTRPPQRLVPLTVLAVLAACRGGAATDADTASPTASPTGTDPASVAACDTFVTELCAVATRCDSELGEADCRDDVVEQGLQCACARDHDEQAHLDCLDQLSTISCDTFANDDVPAVCDGLFSIRCR